LALKVAEPHHEQCPLSVPAIHPLSQGDVIQDNAVRGGKNCGRRTDVFFGLLPSVDTQAPSVTRLEFRKTGGWNRGAQIVARMLVKCQESIGYLGADPMPANVVGPDTAVSVTQKTGHWLQAASLQCFTVIRSLLSGFNSSRFSNRHDHR